MAAFIIGVTSAATFKRTFLELPHDLRLEDCAQVDTLIGEIGRACPWWVGDCALFGEHEYGDRYAQAIENAGLPYQTIANYASVARKFDFFRRRENLLFGHCAEVARLKPAAQDAWLDRAAAKDWTQRELRMHIRKGRLRVTPPPPGTSPVVSYTGNIAGDPIAATLAEFSAALERIGQLLASHREQDRDAWTVPDLIQHEWLAGDRTGDHLEHAICSPLMAMRPVIEEFAA